MLLEQLRLGPERERVSTAEALLRRCPGGYLVSHGMVGGLHRDGWVCVCGRRERKRWREMGWWVNGRWTQVEHERTHTDEDDTENVRFVSASSPNREKI